MARDEEHSSCGLAECPRPAARAVRCRAVDEPKTRDFDTSFDSSSTGSCSTQVESATSAVTDFYEVAAGSGSEPLANSESNASMMIGPVSGFVDVSHPVEQPLLVGAELEQALRAQYTQPLDEGTDQLISILCKRGNEAQGNCFLRCLKDGALIGTDPEVNESDESRQRTI